MLELCEHQESNPVYAEGMKPPLSSEIKSPYFAKKMPSASSCQNASSSCVGPWNPSALDRLDVSTGVQPLSANGSESQTQQIYFVASWKAPDSDGLQPNSAGLQTS